MSVFFLKKTNMSEIKKGILVGIKLNKLFPEYQLESADDLDCYVVALIRNIDAEFNSSRLIERVLVVDRENISHVFLVVPMLGFSTAELTDFIKEITCLEILEENLNQVGRDLKLG